ncbi:dsDNA-binding SOS-regulon protein [Haloferula luteola]|uniref:DsDNA-binding SOS-regulon protein n=1 Tax=Haloferula luteola TaxID=595692 RepID=A0A840VDF1_9BACT|nr:hypothetical protein [Haloferula luteola]MBB5351910.1 dsDNA-binding SOS-regulon protein [Haloferula luteola]
MSREAVLKLSFMGKAPSDRSDLFRILDLAEKMMDGAQRTDSESEKSNVENVIPFPLAAQSGD